MNLSQSIVINKCIVPLSTMISFFQNRKPKQFSYKPRYSDSSKKVGDEKKRISFNDKKYSDAMYDRYDRTPFADLKKAGKTRMMIKAIVLAIILGLLVLYFDKLELLLNEIR